MFVNLPQRLARQIFRLLAGKIVRAGTEEQARARKDYLARLRRNGIISEEELPEFGARPPK